MKQSAIRFTNKVLLTIMMVCVQVVTWAQDTKVEINGNDVGSWFGRNWIWVVAIIAVLLLLLVFGGSSTSRSSSTTTVRRDDGVVTKKVTTIED